MNKRDSIGELSDDKERPLAERSSPEGDGAQELRGVGARPLISGVREQSFADLARRSVAQRQATARELARAAMALSSQSGPPPEDDATRRGDVSRPEAVASSLNAMTASTLAAAEARATPERVATIEQAASPSSELPWSKISLGVATLALAAAVALWLHGRASDSTPAQPMAMSNTSNAADKSASFLAITPPQRPADRDAAPSTEVERDAVELSSLAQEEPAKPSHTAASAASARAKTAQPRATLAPGASEPSPEPSTLANDRASTTRTPGTAPTSPIEKSAPQIATPLPADKSSEDVPMKPSTGAVQAALGAVMSGARRCVITDDAASSAVVVFASDGRVQSVSVSGPAAGRPSGACIQAHLSRARLQPFASATFSVSTAVRPD